MSLFNQIIQGLPNVWRWMVVQLTTDIGYSFLTPSDYSRATVGIGALCGVFLIVAFVCKRAFLVKAALIIVPQAVGGALTATQSILFGSVIASAGYVSPLSPDEFVVCFLGAAVWGFAGTGLLMLFAVLLEAIRAIQRFASTTEGNCPT